MTVKISDSACDKIVDEIGIGRNDRVFFLYDKGIRKDAPDAHGMFSLLTTSKYTLENFSPRVANELIKAAERRGAKTKEFVIDYEQIPELRASTKDITASILEFDSKYVFLLTTNIIFRDFLSPLFKKNIKLIHAAKLTPSIINWFGVLDIDEIKARDERVKSFLEAAKGQTCSIFTGFTKNGKRGKLTLEVPTKKKFATDFTLQKAFNIPSGEVFFQPTRGSANGTIMFPAGIIVNCHPVTRPVKLVVKGGILKDVKTKDAVMDILFQGLKDSNAEVCELGIGTNKFMNRIPMKYRQHNGSMSFEKVYGTFHVAFGSSDHFGEGYGDIENESGHCDIIFPFGELYVGSKVLVKDNKLLV